MSAAASTSEGGRLAENVLHFTRVLRRAGLPVGPAATLDALAALQAVGLARRDDFYHALSSVLVTRHEHQDIFDQAFDLYWRGPSAADIMPGLHDLLAGVRSPATARNAVAPRLAQAMLPGALHPPPESDKLPPELQLDAAMTMSRRETLNTKDFAAMTADELERTRRLIASLRMPLPRIITRRTRPCRSGPDIDLRGTLRSLCRCADGLVDLRRRAPATRQATLVVLCDISGSMERYTRMLLHFLHALSNSGSRVHTFLFGTRLSNITRALRDRDVDAALARVSHQVGDWAGGTRIGTCLHEFNRSWARRLLGQGAVVLLITDGLDSEEAQDLGAQMQRLRLSCRSLLWVNPLLRYAGFEAKPAGIRAMLPHVDRFLPVHNLDSLAQLGEVLAGAAQARGAPPGLNTHHAGDRYGNV